MTVSGWRNAWILWLKVLGLEETKENTKEVVEGDVKSLKLSKNNALVFIMIKSTVEDSDDSVWLFLVPVPAHLGYPGLKDRKTVFVVVVIVRN